MRTFINFFGEPEEVPEEIRRVISNAPIFIVFPLIDEETGIRKNDLGKIEGRRRRPDCLSQNSHEPRPYIVCWNNGGGYTDISFHLKVGGDHGALHAARRMFERYTEKRL
ncbi:hypothetical protein LCGC14_1781950 [marine sediment metagenome]|uniref:Uncharacterized protein n=1 Tax=marine sediment metagenome TaxID=412755 RepID=A0A0F9JA27_9ZZZZ